MKNQNIEVMTSSVDMNWITPQVFVDNLPFEFDLDVCATRENAKCSSYIPPEMNALSLTWTWMLNPMKRRTHYCFMNPPYGRNIGQWIEKAYRESKSGCVVVCLVPNRTETQWFHRIWADASLICFVGKRIKFQHPDPKKAKDGAPFGSVLAVFGSIGESQEATAIAEQLSKIGSVILPGSGNIWLHGAKE